MPAIGVQPIILTDVLLTIGTNDYEAHVSSVMFTPNAPTVNWKGLTPTSNHTFGGLATWTVTLNYAQDWETAQSLSIYLMDNEAQKVVMKFEPQNGGAGFTSNVVLTPGGIGGDVDTVATGSVTLGSSKPARIPAA